MKKISALLLTVFLIILIFISGCSNNNQSSNENPQENEDRDTSVEEKEEPTPEVFVYSYPLTGMAIEEEVDDRAFSVMVNNHPAARPQSGLSKADMVFELLAEGGVTRFLAVFHSEHPETVGPVRSARDYYVRLAHGFDSLYVHHGWSPDAKDLINSGYIDSLNGLYYDGSLFKRASFRVAPHNSYITYENILKGAEQNNFEMTGAPGAYLFLGEDEEALGTDLESVTIDYSTNDFEVRYEYDGVLEKYERYSANELTVEYETEQPVLLDNIFIVETNHEIIDDYGRRDIDIESGGKAILLQRGKLQEIDWKNVDGRIVPFKDGNEVPLVPGKTWINIVPTLNQVVY